MVMKVFLLLTRACWRLLMAVQNYESLKGQGIDFVMIRAPLQCCLVG
jgi:hypothetical protein